MWYLELLCELFDHHELVLECRPQVLTARTRRALIGTANTRGEKGVRQREWVGGVRRRGWSGGISGRTANGASLGGRRVWIGETRKTCVCGTWMGPSGVVCVPAIRGLGGVTGRGRGWSGCAWRAAGGPDACRTQDDGMHPPPHPVNLWWH